MEDITRIQRITHNVNLDKKPNIGSLFIDNQKQEYVLIYDINLVKQSVNDYLKMYSVCALNQMSLETKILTIVFAKDPKTGFNISDDYIFSLKDFFCNEELFSEFKINQNQD